MECTPATVLRTVKKVVKKIKLGGKKMNALGRLWNEESGQGMTEYGLIIGIVSVVLISVLVLFRGKLSDIFNSITNSTVI